MIIMFKNITLAVRMVRGGREFFKDYKPGQNRSTKQSFEFVPFIFLGNVENLINEWADLVAESISERDQ